MFISSYNTICFFVNNFFWNVYISVNTIFECCYLYFGLEMGNPLTMYINRGMERRHSEYAEVRTVGEGYQASCVRTYLHYFFWCFCLMGSCCICRNLTLPSFTKGVFIRDCYLSLMRSIPVVMMVFFTWNCFFESKLTKTLLILIKSYTQYFSVTSYLA